MISLIVILFLYFIFKVRFLLLYFGIVCVGVWGGGVSV